MSKTSAPPAIAATEHVTPISAEAAAAYTVDGRAPACIAAPESVVQLQEILTTAQNIAQHVIPVGGGAHLHLGNPPDAYDLALSAARLNRIVAHEPADMTVTVEAGVRFADLKAQLATHGQWLPLDPPGLERATIGGLLAANVSGPLRHRYGTIRDWLLGTRVVHADGTTSKSGGRVVKNVSGYDLHKLYVGSLGTLAVIAEATFKLAPLPQVERTVAVACPSAAAATAIISAAHERGLAVVAAELLSPTAAHAVCGASSWVALLRVAGGTAAVARTLRELGDYIELAEGSLADTADDIWARWRDSFAPATLSLRFSVMPSRAAHLAESLDRRFVGDAPKLSATVTAGVVRLNLTPSDNARCLTLIESARAVAARYDAFMVIDAAPPAVKQQLDVFGPPRSDIEIMRRLKADFDPQRTLAPGRFMGRI